VRKETKPFILSCVPSDLWSRVLADILSLAERPRPRGSILLQDSRSLRRLGVGAYRASYQVDDAQPVVTIAWVRHRREIYRELCVKTTKGADNGKIPQNDGVYSAA
jgi:mRNA-degrading endonuclease RelE of RelBE toxin-antitoxin system